VGVIALVLAGTVVYYVGLAIQQRVADMRNPAAQEARARRLLGTGVLPEGYPAVIAVSVPFVLDVVLLSDRGSDPSARSSLGQHGFLYTRAGLVLPTDRDELREVVDGQRRHAPILMREHIAIDGAVLRRGRLSAAGAAVSYAVQRGEFKYGRLAHQGLHTLLLIECPSDAGVRMGVWYASETADTGPSPHDLAGSPGDEAALHAFLEHFRLCE
jgi:hypothetical protein